MNFFLEAYKLCSCWVGRIVNLSRFCRRKVQSTIWPIDTKRQSKWCSTLLKHVERLSLLDPQTNLRMATKLGQSTCRELHTNMRPTFREKFWLNFELNFVVLARKRPLLNCCAVNGSNGKIRSNSDLQDGRSTQKQTKLQTALCGCLATWYLARCLSGKCKSFLVAAAPAK